MKPTRGELSQFHRELVSSRNPCSAEEVGLPPVVLYPSNTDAWGECRYSPLHSRYVVRYLFGDDDFFALRDISEAISQQDQSAWYFELRGKIRERIGRDPESLQLAIDDFTAAISLSPNRCSYYQDRLNLYDDLGQRAEMAGDLMAPQQLYESALEKKKAELEDLSDPMWTTKLTALGRCRNALMGLAQLYLEMDDAEFEALHPLEPPSSIGTTPKLDFALNTLAARINHRDVELLGGKARVLRIATTLRAKVRHHMVFVEGRDITSLREAVDELTDVIAIWSTYGGDDLRMLYEVRGWPYTAMGDYALAHADFDSVADALPLYRSEPGETLTGLDSNLFDNPEKFTRVADSATDTFVIYRNDLVKTGIAFGLEAFTLDLLGRTRSADELWIEAEGRTGWTKARLLTRTERSMTDYGWPSGRINRMLCKSDITRLVCT